MLIGVVVTVLRKSGMVHLPNFEVDVVSRCFYPEIGVDEDPVTGSAHTLIGPYWSKRLAKEELLCEQASRRGGKVTTVHNGSERIHLRGRARLYLRGDIEV